MAVLAPMRIRLFHKGLVLILVPLAFEFLFVGGLYFLDAQANAEALRQSRSKEFVAQTNELSIAVLQSSHALLSYKALHSASFLNDYDKIVSGVPALESQLHALAAGTPSREAHLKRLESEVQRILVLLKRFRDPSESVSYLLVNPLTFRMDMESNYRAFLQEVNSINTEESALQLQGSNAERLSRSRSHDFFCFGVVVSIAITIWLVALFSKKITQRLDILAENARRLVRLRQLSDPLAGNDEIAELDRIFHDVARDLKAAEQSKQDYVSMITHDLRTPLATIQSTLSMLQDSPGDDATVERNRILSASNNIKRMNKMLEELLEWEKLEAGMLHITPDLTDLSSIIIQAIASVKEQAEIKRVNISYEPRRIIVSADSERLIHVSANLLANAVKFSPENSTVSVTALEKSDRVTVSVTDEGPGVPPEQREKIFERFQQADVTPKQRTGSGLGLAIAKGLVKAHHGEIGVDSNNGRGSTFWFWIPGN